MKTALCEMPLNVVEILGPDYTNMGTDTNPGTGSGSGSGGGAGAGNGRSQLTLRHDDKSAHRLAPGETLLPAYDSFNSQFFQDPYTVHMAKKSIRSALRFFAGSVPSYVELCPVFDVLLIQRGSESYYKTGCRDREEIYQTSGATRRSISNHLELVETLSNKYGSRFCNVTLERASIYYQYR
jgi:hypothetical protein